VTGTSYSVWRLDTIRHSLLYLFVLERERAHIHLVSYQHRLIVSIVYGYSALCSQLLTNLVLPREQRTRHLRHGPWRPEDGANP